MHYPTILSWESASLLYFLNRQNMVCIIFSMLNGKIWKGQIFIIKRTAWKGSLGPRIWWRRSKKHTYQPFYLQILLGYRLCIKYHKTCQIPVWKFHPKGNLITESPITNFYDIQTMHMIKLVIIITWVFSGYGLAYNFFNIKFQNFKI